MFLWWIKIGTFKYVFLLCCHETSMPYKDAWPSSLPSMPQISKAFQSTSLIAAASSTSRVSLARRNWVQRIGQSQWLSCVKLENVWKIDEPKVFHWIVMAGFRSSPLSVFSSFWATVFVRPDKFQICYEHCAAVRQLLFCRSCGCLANIIAAIF